MHSIVSNRFLLIWSHRLDHHARRMVCDVRRMHVPGDVVMVFSPDRRSLLGGLAAAAGGWIGTAGAA